MAARSIFRCPSFLERAPLRSRWTLTPLGAAVFETAIAILGTQRREQNRHTSSAAVAAAAYNA